MSTRTPRTPRPVNPTVAEAANQVARIKARTTRPRPARPKVGDQLALFDLDLPQENTT